MNSLAPNTPSCAVDGNAYVQSELSFWNLWLYCAPTRGNHPGRVVRPRELTTGESDELQQEASHTHPFTRGKIDGMGPTAQPGYEDFDLINAGKQFVTLLPGGSYFHHADSFGMMRGGHIDICVLGAYQVSTTGDLANWHTGDESAIPAVGGAMDLAVGARQTWVMMDLLTRDGQSKVVDTCQYPLTGMHCVKRIYGDLATLACGPGGIEVLDMVDGLELAELAALLKVPLKDARQAPALA